VTMAARLKVGAAWLAGARLIVNLLGIITTLVMARLLTPEDFGIVAIGTSIFAIVTAVTELSLANAIIHHPEPTDDHFNSAFTLGLVRAALIACMVAMLAWPIASFYGDLRLFGVLLAVAFGTLLTGLANPKVILFQRALDFRFEFLNVTSQRLATMIISVTGAIIFQNYWAMIIGNLSAQIVLVVISYTKMPFWPKVSFRKAKDLLSFSIWLTASQVITTINWRLDQLFIGHILGRPLLGAYSLGDTLAQLPTREITAPISQTLFPAFSRMSGDKRRLLLAYQRAQATLSMLAFPVGLGFAVICHPLLLLTVGVKWEEATLVVQILSAIFALQTIASPVQSAAMALNQNRMTFGRDVLNLLIRFPFVLGGLLIAGLPGVIFGRCISSMIGMLINMALVRRLFGLGILPQIWANRRSLLAAVALVAAALTAQLPFRPFVTTEQQMLAVGVTVLVGGAVYVVSLMVLWIIEGRPDGPERELVNVMQPVLQRALKGIKVGKARHG
jgi:O-antigen/teichoic acid export membrane protein